MAVQQWHRNAVPESGAVDVKNSDTDKEKILAARTRQKALGRELRRMYDEVVNEPVPDEFTELLRKIDSASAKKGPK